MFSRAFLLIGISLVVYVRVNERGIRAKET